MIKYIFIISFIVLIGLFIFVKWASFTSVTDGQNPALIVNANQNEFAFKSFKVMTWNIGYGYGLGSEGTNYRQLSRELYLQKLKEMTTVINREDPDILLVQEIDFDSKRSTYLNQVELIAKNTNLKNYAYLPSWVLNYVPFPYLPFKDHFGRMNSGGAIFSRYKITEHIGSIYSKPSSNPWWYNLFYLNRYTHTIKIGPLRLFNTHLEAFDKINRYQQIMELSNWVNDFKNEPTILGGDFNMVADYEKNKRDFQGYPDDDYTNDTSYSTLLKKLSFLRDTLSKDQYFEDKKNFLTFPSDQADRKLDYIFVSDHFKILNSKVLDNTLSDHKAYLTELELLHTHD
jgi:endonuclease/exonuclease/phosphatase family metal-dependent hydrolase